MWPLLKFDFSVGAKKLETVPVRKYSFTNNCAFKKQLSPIYLKKVLLHFVPSCFLSMHIRNS